MTLTNRAIINGGIFSFILAAIGWYQGETLLTVALAWLFAWLVMSSAFWFSYRLTQSKLANKQLLNGKENKHKSQKKP